MPGNAPRSHMTCETWAMRLGIVVGEGERTAGSVSIARCQPPRACRVASAAARPWSYRRSRPGRDRERPRSRCRGSSGGKADQISGAAARPLRLGGGTIGIIANNPLRLGGGLDATSAEKAARFVRMCDAFGVPLLVLVDVPGYLPGVGQEHDGVVRRGAKLLHAFAEATVPRVTLVTRKAYGGAYIAMNSRSLGATKIFAWPTAEIAVMGPVAAVRILHRRKLAAVPDDQRHALEACGVIRAAGRSGPVVDLGCERSPRL